MVDMKTYAGDYILNHMHFGHYNLNKLDVFVNNVFVYNIHTRFPLYYSYLYYSFLSALGIDKEHILIGNDLKMGERLQSWICKLRNCKMQLMLKIQNLRIAPRIQILCSS